MRIKFGNFLLETGTADMSEVIQLRKGIFDIQDKMKRLEHRSRCDNLGFHIIVDAVAVGHDIDSIRAIVQEIEYAENAEQYRAIRSKYIKEVPQP